MPCEFLEQIMDPLEEHHTGAMCSATESYSLKFLLENDPQILCSLENTALKQWIHQPFQGILTRKGQKGKP
uniref:Uncharacterized protein n=1 Tax=Setaria italica TaxID=4555 RepID=K3ZPU5_SETIT